MAFVFRSQRKDATEQKNQSEEVVLVEETKKEREVRQGNVCKGLPFLSKKQVNSNLTQKENSFPLMEANPIHPGSFNFKNAVFKVREFNDTKLIKQTQPVQKKPIMIVKEISSENLALSMARLESKKSKVNNQSLKEISKMKEDTPTIVSKNLMKTMLHLSQKAKEKLQNEKIVIDSSKSPEEPKKNRFRNWKSLKKLSPLKDYSKFNITAETDGIDLSCGPLKQLKEEEQPKKKQVKVRVNPRKLIQSAEEMEDEEDQYITEATPGPGAYSYNLTSKKQFRSKRKKFQKIFYSQIERFQENQKKFQEVTYINDEHQASSKEPISRENSQPFLSKSPKFPQKRQNESPPPGYYETRQTLEHDLVRHILKSSNSTTFINRSPRVFKVKGDNIPGPGSYALDRSLQKLLQQKNLLSFSYKSQQQRKMDDSDKGKGSAKKVNLMEQGERVNPIHMKEDSILEDYYYTEPVPFLSSTERFPQLQPPTKLLTRSDLKTDTILKATPPRQPFNSSQKRQTMGKVGDGIGIGLYNLCKDTWSKKSYNILYQ